MKAEQIVEFEKCPRCGGEWKEAAMFVNGKKEGSNFFLCQTEDCFMSKSETGGILQLNLSPSRMIVWNIKDHISVYMVEDMTKSYTSVNGYSMSLYITNCKLPWLPFDITYERLKTLILFS